jgi:hypothetical protein
VRAHGVRAAAAGLLLAGPFVLAFFAGGFFDEARLWAALAAWGLAAIGAVCAQPAALAPARGAADGSQKGDGQANRARSRSRRALRRAMRPPAAGWVAAAGLAGLCAWTALSAGWAPLAGPAVADLQRLVLYLGAFVAALLLLPAVPRAVEPALAAGCTMVIAYALAGRLLPGVVVQEASASAFGRLEQPLTYWNATGLLAALGAVLAVRLAGDRSRSRRLRAAGGAAVPALLCGLVLSFSRGALLACAVGVLAVCLLAADRGQVRAAAVSVACALPAVVVALALDGVRALGGDAAGRERDGLIALAVLAAASAIAGWRAVRERPAPTPAGRRRGIGRAGSWRTAAGARRGIGRAGSWRTAAGARRAIGRAGSRRTAAGALVLVAGALAVAAGAGSSADPPATGATPARLASADSNRYDYWAVALSEWRAEPLRGGGAGSFRVAWLRERSVPEAAQDAHSLYLETLAELGLAGAVLLLAFLVPIGAAAAWAPPALAGPVGALLAWAFHAGVDWDWEMPAVTLPALVLAAHALGAPAAVSARPARD